MSFPTDDDLNGLLDLDQLGVVLLEEEQDDYSQLPQPVKGSLSREEYLWLSDAEKKNLVERECEPEVV